MIEVEKQVRAKIDRVEALTDLQVSKIAQIIKVEIQCHLSKFQPNKDYMNGFKDGFQEGFKEGTKQDYE